MTNHEKGLLALSIAIVAVVVGAIFSMTPSGDRLAQVDYQRSAPTSAQVADKVVKPPAAEPQIAEAQAASLCGNGIIDDGEACDPYDQENLADCSSDCTEVIYLDSFQCLQDRIANNCADANHNPLPNYYDCVDAQNTYCQGLTF